MKRFLVLWAVGLSLLWLGTAWGQFGGDQPGIPGCGSMGAGGNLSGPQVPGGCGPDVQQPNPITTGPALQGSLLLEDGVSFLLLEDNSSHLCFEGGC